MKLLLAAALVLMLSSLALAASETEQLGPYTVTFDMNTPMQYQVQVQEPIETPYSTIYSLRISTDDTTGAGIGITEYKDKTDATLSVAKQLIVMDMALRGINVTTAPEDLTIDGQNGFLIAGEPVSEATNAPQQPAKLFRAGYWLDSVDCECGPVSVGNVNVGISSSYPEDVTRDLVNTIRVTSGQAPAQAMAGQQQMTQQMTQGQMTQGMPPSDMSQMPPQ